MASRHGSSDTVLHTQNYHDAIRQWTSVSKVSSTPPSLVTLDSPAAVHANKVIGYLGIRITHNVEQQEQLTLEL